MAIMGAMKFAKACLVYLVFLAVIGSAIVLASNGNYWLLALALPVYVVLIGRFGCASH
jgi:hypothetical protein